MEPRVRRRRAVAIALALALAAVALAPAAADETPTRSVAELVGATDGFALTVEASGDLAGSLETCGCPKRPMGGFAWRTGYAAELAKATKGEVPLVEVDAGRAFADDLTPAGMADDVRIKNEWMLRSFAALDVAAVNVAHSDLVYLAPMMASKGYGARERHYPALARLVSANVVPKTAAARRFRPYLVRTVSGGRLGGRRVRVGLVGVTEPAPAALADRLAVASASYTIGDPVEAVRRAMPELRAKCDLVVVLAYVDRATAQRIGALGPDVVVAAHQFPLFNKTDAAGDATVAYVSTQTKWLSELRLARASAGRLSVVAHRDVPLDAATPSDPDAAALVGSARAEFTAAQQAALERETTGATAATIEARRAALAEASPFAGSESCATCHAYQYKVWQASRHSHAFRTLEEKNRHLDAACTVCHTVRQGEEGGFLSSRLTPRLENVQCESCHGPGKQHVKAPAEPGYGRVDLPSRCVSCHTHENDPDFDFPTYWPKIQHHQDDASAGE
jgi:2',3'-cyclic-nucleotide 2'-phosphodiesterase (5'-nucleotidase family)